MLLVKSFCNTGTDRTIKLRKQLRCKWPVIVAYLVINSNSRFFVLGLRLLELKRLEDGLWVKTLLLCLCLYSAKVEMVVWVQLSWLPEMQRAEESPVSEQWSSLFLSLSVVVVQIDKNLISQNAIVLFKQDLLLVPTIIGKLPFCGDATVWSACEEGVGKAT